MSVVYVTSFSPDLYVASGKNLVESFMTVHRAAFPGDELLICHEGKIALPRDDGLMFADLDTDEYLQDWLTANADIIPDYLGGNAEECRCKGREKRHATHTHGCHWAWMNRNASRWFRKVASLRSAVDVGFRCNYLVWLDSDTIFTAPLPESYLREQLTRAAMFYFRGHRPAVESGILGLCPANGADTLIDELCVRYESAFRFDERWDDGYQIAKLVEETKIPTVDLVHPTKYASGKRKTNNVIPTTDIVKYVSHFKGLHGTKLGIMR